MSDETTLLRRYAETHAEEAFAELVRRYLDGVYSVALRRVGGDVQLAQDVTQEVFTALARAAGRLAQHPVLIGWLYATTRNAAANVVRRERRRKAREQEAQAMHDMLAKESPTEEWNRVEPLLEGAIDQLSEADRLAVLLRFIERQSFADIGAALRLNEDTARKRVDRALDKLRGLLARRGITSTAAALGVALANHAVAAAPASLATTVTSAALATAPAGASMVASLLGFMSTTKATLGIAAIAMIAALGTATYEVRARQAAEAALATARQAHESRLARLRDLTQQAQTAEQDAARLKQVMADQAAAKARAVADAAKAATAWDPIAEGKAFLARHPEVKQAIIASQIADLNFRYSALFKSLGLTPAQIDEFLKIKHATSSGVNSRTLGPESKQVVFLAGDIEQMQYAPSDLRELLGDVGYQKLQEFDRVDSARQLAVQAASALSFTETPLTSAQAEQLIQILDSNRAQRSGTQASRFAWDTVFAQARDVLSAPQLAALDGIRMNEQAKRVTPVPIGSDPSPTSKTTH